MVETITSLDNFLMEFVRKDVNLSQSMKGTTWCFRSTMEFCPSAAIAPTGVTDLGLSLKEIATSVCVTFQVCNEESRRKATIRVMDWP